MAAIRCWVITTPRQIILHGMTRKCGRVSLLFPLYTNFRVIISAATQSLKFRRRFFSDDETDERVNVAKFSFESCLIETFGLQTFYSNDCRESLYLNWMLNPSLPTSSKFNAMRNKLVRFYIV